jgi:hypothetical protein
MSLCLLGKRFIGCNHQPQKLGGPRRPPHHSGKRKSKSAWESDIMQVQLQNEELRKLLADTKAQLVGAEAAAAITKNVVANTLIEEVSEKDTLRKQLEDTKTKLMRAEAATADKNEELRTQTLQMHALASINQRLQLDLEWAVMLRSAKAEPPTVLRKRVHRIE